MPLLPEGNCHQTLNIQEDQVRWEGTEQIIRASAGALAGGNLSESLADAAKDLGNQVKGRCLVACVLETLTSGLVSERSAIDLIVDIAAVKIRSELISATGA
ncbi:hypothetical protein XPA_010582 [Xanthoria parietina]